VTVPSDRVLAIDIGGTKLAFAEVSGEDVIGRDQIHTPRSGGDVLVDAIAAQIRGRGASRVAIATTGIVQEGTLTALNPATLPIEDHYPLARRIAAVAGVTPLIVNDAQAAAWGEYKFGAGRGRRNFMFVTVSTGVGGGLVVEGDLLTGRRGLAGHVGHIPITGAVRVCGCGRRGCLETVASGTAIAARYAERTGRAVKAPDVFAAARSGDEDADLILDEAASALAEMFANIVAANDPDSIALGGGVGLAETFLDRVQRHCSALPAVFQRPVETVKAGSDAGMIGVADLFVKKNFIR